MQLNIHADPTRTSICELLFKQKGKVRIKHYANVSILTNSLLGAGKAKLAGEITRLNLTVKYHIHLYCLVCHKKLKSHPLPDYSI